MRTKRTGEGGWERDPARPAPASCRWPSQPHAEDLLQPQDAFAVTDYYEPWTYDYDTLISAPAQKDTPVARPISLIDGRPMKIDWSANWDDDLGGATRVRCRRIPILKKLLRRSG